MSEKRILFSIEEKLSIISFMLENKNMVENKNDIKIIRAKKEKLHSEGYQLKDGTKLKEYYYQRLKSGPKTAISKHNRELKKTGGGFYLLCTIVNIIIF